MMTTSSSGSSGSARNMSVSRIRRPSSPLKKPASTPTRVPSTSEISIAVKPTASDYSAPRQHLGERVAAEVVGPHRVRE